MDRTPRDDGHRPYDDGEPRRLGDGHEVDRGELRRREGGVDEQLHGEVGHQERPSSAADAEDLDGVGWQAERGRERVAQRCEHGGGEGRGREVG